MLQPRASAFGSGRRLTLMISAVVLIAKVDELISESPPTRGSQHWCEGYDQLRVRPRIN